jgi:hypothetical protein
MYLSKVHLGSRYQPEQTLAVILDAPPSQLRQGSCRRCHREDTAAQLTNRYALVARFDRVRIISTNFGYRVGDDMDSLLATFVKERPDPSRFTNRIARLQRLPKARGNPAANVDKAAAYDVNAGLHLRLGERPTRHRRHLKGKLQTLSESPAVT